MQCCFRYYLVGTLIVGFTFTLSSLSFPFVSLFSPSSPVKVKPGEFATQVVEVVSEKDLPPTYHLKLSLPEGWAVLQPPSPTFLKANVAQYFFITYQVPFPTLAGEYQSLVEFILPPEKVLARVKLITRVVKIRGVYIKAPLAKKAVPRESVTYTFTVVNRGNTEDTYRINIFSSPTWQVKLSQPTISLSPAVSARIKVNFSVPVSPKVDRHFLRVKVSSILEPKISAETEVYTSILPPRPEEIPKILYPFLPATARIKGEYDPETNEITSGADLDISGSIDKLGRVSVSASIPDIKKPTLKLNRYLLQAYRKDWKISLGDTSASFTSILGLSGRGIKVEKKNLPLRRSFTFFSTLSGEKGKIGAGFELPRKNTLLKIGALRDEEEPDGLAGFFLDHNFSRGWSVNMEEAFTLRGKKNDYAWKGAISYFKKDLSFTGRYNYGSPNFPKDISDKKVISLSSRFNPLPNMRLATSFNQSRTNVEANPAYPISIKRNTAISLSYLSTSPHLPPYRMELRQEWYSSSHPLMDGLSWTFRLSAQKYIFTPILSLTLYGWVEIGEQRNKLTGEVFKLKRYREQVSMYKKNLSLWLWREEGKRWDKDKGEVVFSRSQGIGLGYHFSRKGWNFNLGYSNVGNKDWQESFSLDISCPLTARTYFQIKAKAQGMAGADKDWLVTFGLGTGFNLPFFLVKTKGIIEGTVFLDRNFNGTFDSADEPLKDLIVSIKGVSVSTNERGEYRFSPLVPGLYQLRVENIPAGWMSEKKLPLLVEVKAGRIKKVNIPLVRSAVVQGQVYQDTNRNGKKDPDERGVALVRVIVQDAYGKKWGSFTDNLGQFEIYELFPGDYEVYPDPKWLPKNMKLTTSKLVKIKIGPGEIKKCWFGIAPPRKKIIITFRPPQAKFTFSPPSPKVGEKVSFNASASFDPDGKIVKYEWDFDNDGKVDAQGVVVKHIFKKVGSYSVILIVTDNDGNLGFIVHEIKVK